MDLQLFLHWTCAAIVVIWVFHFLATLKGYVAAVETFGAIYGPILAPRLSGKLCMAAIVAFIGFFTL